MLVRTLKVMAADRPGGVSFMEDYTYHFGPGEPKILGAHMLEVCPSIAAGRPTLRDPPLGHRRPGGPRQARFRRPPGPGFVVGLLDLGRPAAAGRQRHRDRPPRRAPAQAPGGARRVEAGARAWPPRPNPGSRPAGPITRPSAPPSTSRPSRTWPWSPASNWSVSMRRRPPQSFRRELAWSQAYYRLAHGLARG